jgi:hypothetical protein
LEGSTELLKKGLQKKKLFNNSCNRQKLGIFDLIEARTEPDSSAIKASTERKVGQKGQF